MAPRDEDLWSNIDRLTFENEATVETRLIQPLLRALGYDEAEDVAPKYPVVFREGRRGRRPEVDFVVFAERPHSRATSLIAIEAKRPGEKLADGKAQGESYAENVKTPLLLLTNGVRLEVWQIQPSTESELAFACDVRDLPARRGEVEALLAKEAVKAYSRTLPNKTFGIVARDLGAYERAEFERQEAGRFPVARRLVAQGPRPSTCSSTDLLRNCPEGALIVGASGFGKTTLAQLLRRQALEQRWSSEGGKLPVEVFLPDVLEGGGDLEAYLRARIAKHCRQVSAHVFEDRLREEGLVLICDGFERVAPERRSQVESGIADLRRDFPKTQLFLLTRPSARPHRLPLTALDLQELDDSEQYEIVERFSSAEGFPRPSFWNDAPDFLRQVCRHPLILSLALDAYKEQGRLPRQVEPLFASWLGRVLPDTIRVEERVDLRKLLTCIANETVSGPITEEDAVRLVRGGGFPGASLQTLIETDALSRRGQTIEVQHEALADYLRALHVCGLSPAEASERLDLMALRSGSQLPALLMVTARSAQMQELVWSRIAAVDIGVAVSALRYRADTSAQVDPSDQVRTSTRYLTELLDGIDVPLDAHFGRLAERVRQGLVGEVTDAMAVTGSVSTDGSHLGYAFRAAEEGGDRVAFGPTTGARRLYGKSLRGMALRLDSGRLVGMGHIQEELLELVKHRRLDGGLLWAEERAMGRLRHLARAYDLPYRPGMSLRRVVRLLERAAGEWVEPDAYRSGQTFEIDELLTDIDLLLANGKTRLKPWWAGADKLDLRSPEGQARMGELLDLHHRRTQLAYKEVVEVSFPEVAAKFPLYQTMPLRFTIEVELQSRDGYDIAYQNWTSMPVATFEEAGADVSFPEERSDHHSNEWLDEYKKRTDEALARYGRVAPNSSYALGWKRLPDFFGHDPSHGGQVDETVVVRSVAKRVAEGIKRVFRDLPGIE